MSKPSPDKLSAMLNKFTITAGVFYSGNLCGLSVFDERQTQQGHLHVLKSGELDLYLPERQKLCVNEPSLMFFAKPIEHRFEINKECGADLVCATVGYGVNALNPVTSGLPDYLIIPLSEVPNLASVCDWLFTEAFATSDGRGVVMDRLCELLVIEIFRHLLGTDQISRGVFSGLSHPRLASVLHALHGAPEQNWKLEEMANLAAMSRSSFADAFKTVVGQTPAEYLADWRVSIAQKKLKQGQSVSLVANLVGYENSTTFSRVFKKRVGLTPTEWLKQGLNN